MKVGLLIEGQDPHLNGDETTRASAAMGREELARCDVVITVYDMLRKPKKGRDRVRNLLLSIHWRRVVLDEVDGPAIHDGGRKTARDLRDVSVDGERNAAVFVD